MERPALRAMLDLLEPRAEHRLLDLGTGTGALLGQIARSQPRPKRAVGLDSSVAMLARVADLPDGWELIRAEASELPFADASFDLVTASYLLHLLGQEERTRVIAEARRVLAPGGRLGAITIAPPASSLGRLVSAPVRALARRSDGALAGLRPLDPRAELQAAGLQPLGARRVYLGYPSLCVVCGLPPQAPVASA